MESNLITILLPVYNDEKYLKKSLDSIRAQTHKDFICLVGFNGTTDLSKKIFKRTTKEDPRFLMFDFGEDKGKARTLNKLLDEVKTERVCLMDGDDIWHPEKLKKQLEVGGDFDVIGTLATYIDERGKKGITMFLSEDPHSIRSLNLQGENQIINSSSLIKTSCLLEIGGWDPEVEGLEDFDVWVKLSILGKNFYNIQIPLVYHRIHKGSNFNSKALPYSPVQIVRKNSLKMIHKKC